MTDSSGTRRAPREVRAQRSRPLLGVRPGEAPLVLAFVVAFAALEAGRGLGETGIRAVVLDEFGKDVLPGLFVALGAAGVLTTLSLGAFLGPGRGAVVAVVAPLAAAGVLVVGRVASLRGPPVLLQALWVGVHLAGLLVLTLLWVLATRVFDARQAKRLFPLCAGAATGGYLAGTLSAGPAAGLVGAANLVLLQAGLLVVVDVAVARLRPHLRPPTRREESAAAVLRDGAGYILRSPLLRLVGVAYILFAVLLFAMSYPYWDAMEQAFPDDAALASALGLVAAASTATSIVVAVSLAKRLYLRFGIATVALVLPAMYLGGFAIWLVAFTLPIAIGVRITQEVVQRGVANAAWSAVFSAVPRGRRGPVLAFMDAVPGHVGTILSGILLALAASWSADLTPVFVLGLTVAVACLIVCLGARRRYGATVLATLREGVAEQAIGGEPGFGAVVRDRRVVAGLVAASRSPRPADRKLAAEVIGTAGPGAATPVLVSLLSDDVPDVRLAALTALTALGRLGAGPRQEVLPLLSDPEPDVRRAAVAAAGAGADEVAHLAGDPDPAVRAEVVVALAATGARPEALRLVEQLFAGDDDEVRAGLDAVRRTGLEVPGVDLAALTRAESAPVRAAAIAVVGRHARRVGSDAPAPGSVRPSIAELLSAGLDDENASVRDAAAAALRVAPGGDSLALAALHRLSDDGRAAALAALDGTVPATRSAVIAWAVDEVRRATRFRTVSRLLVADDTEPYLADPPEALVTDARPRVNDTRRASAAFLATLLARKVDAIVDLCLRAVALLGATDAVGPIRRALASNDPEMRATAVEALDAVGAPRLARAVVGLLDSGEPKDGATRAHRIPDVARELVSDDDPWVRALALRTLDDDLADKMRLVRSRAADDPSTAVAVAFATADRQEGLMPEKSPAPGIFDRMLLLREVPLFASLGPEDLRRMASVAVDRVYAGGEELVREGDVGDDLFVITKGTVQVLQHGADGERLVREVGHGEHVGELAVLRPGLRTATLRASDPAVRVLVVGGPAVRAVLRERPEAALAMLATLADRIGQGW